MIKRTALNRLLGGKLVKPVSSVAKSANEMLDTEHEYLTYLRNRKKFFFMTQVQQTRVVLGKKGKGHEDKSKFGGGGGLPYIRRPRGKKLTKNQLRAKQKGNRVGRFMRNRKAQGLRAGRKLGRTKPGRFVNSLEGRGQRAGQALRRAPGRALTGIKDTASKVKLPKLNLPKVNMPKVSLPKVKLPSMKGGPGPLSLLFAGLEFGGRKLQGQTNLQAGVGAGASAAGGSAGFAAGAKAGAFVGTFFGPGIGTAIGAGIGGLLGGMIGANLAGGAADMVTGANKPKTKKYMNLMTLKEIIALR